MPGEIITNLIDTRRTTAMMSSMSKPGGRLTGGVPLSSADESWTQLTFNRNMLEQTQEWASSFFGDYSDRYLLTAAGSGVLKPEDVTAIGGICAIRSADLALMRNGHLADPEYGGITEYSSTIEVAEWIEKAVGIDQAIESIGLYIGDEYAVISERKMWLERIVTTIGARIPITQADIDMLAEALQVAENSRIEMIRRYISYAKGKDVNINFFSDEDLYEELIDVRDEMLRLAEVGSVEALVKRAQFDNERATISVYSIVWGMYTGPYLDLLKERSIVRTNRAVLLEPWPHATAETQSKGYVSERYFMNTGNYLSEGPNSDLGFTAYYDTLLPNGKRMRLARNIGQMPNVLNYQRFIAELSQSNSGGSLALSENEVFMWGANLFPYGITKQALLGMIELKDEYKRRRGEIQHMPGDKKQLAADLKGDYQQKMVSLSQIIIMELQQMLATVWSD